MTLAQASTRFLFVSGRCQTFSSFEISLLSRLLLQHRLFLSCRDFEISFVSKTTYHWWEIQIPQSQSSRFWKCERLCCRIETSSCIMRVCSSLPRSSEGQVCVWIVQYPSQKKAAVREGPYLHEGVGDCLCYGSSSYSFSSLAGQPRPT